MKHLFQILAFFISATTFAQEFSSDNTLVNSAFKLAVETIDINTRRGILAAGGDYGGEWTRDIAINSWNAASLLRPKVAAASLWSVTIKKDSIGHQYWDKIIWAVAACNHYEVTGDKAFLVEAYRCSANTMKELENSAFDQKYGMFTGPSVFNDGIAAYPEPIYDATNFSGGALDHKNTYTIKCLSTNCLYYGAYLTLSKMSNYLKEKPEIAANYNEKATILKANILKYLYDKDKNKLNYLIDHEGKLRDYQEGLGISFAAIFGIINGEKAKELLGNAVVSQYGITSITPDFTRYSKDMPGRHNNLIWPFINGFFANAALKVKNYSTFDHEFFAQAHLAIDEDKGNYNFREIFNPNNGKPDGGYQDWGPERPNYHWESCKLQTWSATAFISMVDNGLFGMKFSEDRLSFTPYLPDGINWVNLKKLTYRDASFNISVKGKGNTIKSFILDGKRQNDYSVPASLKGKHAIAIVVGN